MDQNPPTESHSVTHWHRLLGKFLELLLTPFDISVQTEIQITSEPPKIDIMLLRRRGEHWTAQQRALLPDGLGDSRASHLLLECKFTESFNLETVRQVIGYDHFYRQAQRLREQQLQSFVICARTPKAATLQLFGYQLSKSNGVYLSTQEVLKSIPLISLNELNPTPNNAFVQCFASRSQIRKAAFSLLEKNHWNTFTDLFWDYLAGLQSTIEVEGIRMSYIQVQEELTPELVLETGKRLRKALIETLTPEEIEQALTQKPELRQEVMRSLSAEDRLAGLAPEDRLAGLAPEDRLAGLAPEEVEVLFQQIAGFLRTQQLPNKR